MMIAVAVVVMVVIKVIYCEFLLIAITNMRYKMHNTQTGSPAELYEQQNPEV